MDIERVLLIFMVIVLHYNNRAMGGALTYGYVGGVIEVLVRFSQSLSICAVDAFLILSGYFSATGTYTLRGCIRKSVWLLMTCSFYRVIGYLIYALAVTGDFSIKTLVAYIIPANWYVCMFVTVIMLCPYLNKLLGLLGTKSRRELIGVMSVLFCVVPTVVSLGSDILGVNLQGLATITMDGDIDGFTIVSFVYCYCLGYCIRQEKKICDQNRAIYYLAIYLVSAMAATSISYYTEKVWSYSGIFTVICALALTLFFTKIRVGNEIIGKLASAIGGCGLGIFVWHTMPLMIFGYWVHMGIDSIGTGTARYLGNFWISTLSMYLLSAVWVYACRCVVRIIRSKTKSKA